VTGRVRASADVKTIEAVATTSAPREAVWALLEDAPTWAEWGMWSSVEVEGGGDQRAGKELAEQLALVFCFIVAGMTAQDAGDST
jgi:hypothetical protein